MQKFVMQSLKCSPDIIENSASKTGRNQKVNFLKCIFIMKYIVNETHVHKGMTIHIYFSSFTFKCLLYYYMHK